MIAGYGWHRITVYPNKEEIGGINDTDLRFAEADVISNEECQSGYQLTRIYEAQICARTKQRDVDEPSGVCSVRKFFFFYNSI